MSLLIGTYSDLVDQMTSFMGNRDELDVEIQSWIFLTECDIQNKIKFRRPSHKTITGASISGQNYIELPDDYLSMEMFSWDSTSQPSVLVSTLSELEKLQKRPTPGLSSSHHNHIHVRGNRLYFGTVPDGDTYTLYYTAGIIHLSADEPTNFILTTYPQAMLFGSLVLGMAWDGQPEKVPMWASMYENALETTRVAEQNAQFGGGTLAVRPDIDTP